METRVKYQNLNMPLHLSENMKIVPMYETETSNAYLIQNKSFSDTEAPAGLKSTTHHGTRGGGWGRCQAKGVGEPEKNDIGLNLLQGWCETKVSCLRRLK